jgi:hypothetical protein
LCQVVDTLFTEVDAAHGDILRRSLADSLDDDGGVGLEDDAVVDDLVYGEGDKVVVLDDRSFVYRLPLYVSTCRDPFASQQCLLEQQM